MQDKRTQRQPGMLKTLLSCVREYKKPTIITLALIVGEVIIEVLLPFILANLVNVINAGAELSAILKTGLLLVLLTIVSLACGSGGGISCAKAAAGFAKNIRHDLFRKVQSYSFENIDKFSSSSLVTRMTTDVTNVQMAFMMLIRIAVRAPLMLIFAIIMAFIMGGWLALSFVVVIPILIWGFSMIAKRAMPAFRSVFHKYDQLNESIEENVQAMRVVKGFTREEYEKQKFNKAASAIQFDFTKAERIVALNQPIMQLCMYINTAFILIMGAKLAIGGSIGVGQISSMLNYGMQILMSLMMLSMIYVMLTLSIEAANRICEVLNEVPTLSEPEEPVMKVENGAIDFENVSFKYSENAKLYALKDINLHIPSGATVGVIGGTGSSKSSLVQLIPRLYDATIGCVKVGGVDVRQYDIDTLRGQVAMVLQKNQLFSGTIKDNLRWGNEKATDAEMEEACRLAQADEFIQTFPDKYDTWIEQGGTNVSGGQKQRLCIARALLKKPKVLILDDSTSAVDTKTDAMIRMGFKQFIPETTKIIIAQRISSVQESDLIVVMNNGMIEDAGSHEELLSRCQIYREVYEQQTKGGDKDAR